VIRLLRGVAKRAPVRAGPGRSSGRSLRRGGPRARHARLRPRARPRRGGRLARSREARRPRRCVARGLGVSTLRGSRRRSGVRRIARPCDCDVRGRGSALRERRDGLARADRRRAQREARHARPAGRKAGGGSTRVAENTMFFPRLRSQAKWAFVLLILVFGGGFVFLGVGSGGLDLGSLIRDAFGRSSGSGTSVSKAQTEVSKHPLDPAARKTLASALEKKGRVDEAITAWTQYTKLRPKDLSALRHLAQLELGQADTFLQQAQLASLAQQ